MEINRKLEHLTEEQIEEVITMYKDKSIRLSNIISKYNIDVKPKAYGKQKNVHVKAVKQ